MDIELIQFRKEHFSTIQSWISYKREAVEWAGPKARYPVSSARLARMLGEAATTPPLRRCWCATQRGEVVGHAQAAFDRSAGIARLANVIVAPVNRRTGVGKTMVALCLRQLFSKAGIHRVELNVYSHNVAAIRLYERLGFRHEGLRRAACRVGGEFWDSMLMGLLRSELSRAPMSVRTTSP